MCQWHTTGKLRRASEDLAGDTLSARGDVRRGGDELLSLFGNRNAGRALPVRRAGAGNARRPSGNVGSLLARISAERRPGAAVRLPRARPVGAAERASL